MAICYDDVDFQAALEEALDVSPSHPVLLDRCLGRLIRHDISVTVQVGKRFSIAEKLVADLGLEGSNPVVTPVVKPTREQLEGDRSIPDTMGLPLGAVPEADGIDQPLVISGPLRDSPNTSEGFEKVEWQPIRPQEPLALCDIAESSGTTHRPALVAQNPQYASSHDGEPQEGHG